MRILHINILYAKGSTGKILQDIHTRLERDGHESFVIYGLSSYDGPKDPLIIRNGSDFLAHQYRRLIRLTGLRYNIAYVETRSIINKINEIKPDIVHIHNLNSGTANPFMLFRWLGKHDYRVLVTHHADIYLSATCDHAYDCTDWITGCRRHCKDAGKEQDFIYPARSRRSWMQMKKALGHVQRLYSAGVSGWMTDRVRRSPFFHDHESRTIENGIDTLQFRFDDANVPDLLRKYREDGKKIIIHVTPLFSQAVKGGEYVLEMARRFPETIFLVIGRKGNPTGIIPDNVVFLPYVTSKKELAGYYRNADLTLLTSKRESFSMVTAESLCCGTPVVGFKAGAPETIALEQYSEFVEYGDTDALELSVRKWLDSHVDKKSVSHKAVDRYNAERMYGQYLDYYRNILSSK